MKKLLALRLLTLSIMMFTTGLITGWWWHEMLDNKSEKASFEVLNYRNWLPLGDSSNTLEPLDIPQEIIDFEQALEDLRYDDALIIFQRQERLNSDLSERLVTVLMQKTDEWSEHREYSIAALERFTQHYYQNPALLHKLSELYTAQYELEKAIEVLINAQSFTSDPDKLRNMATRIHELSRLVYDNRQTNQQLHETLPLFQKLATMEPDRAFYRFALAQGYLSTDDSDHAIRELELLQTDEEFGRQASRQLSDLLPPVQEEPEEMPASAIPLIAEGNHYIVAALTQNKSQSRLLIDTGASLTTLPDALLKELKRKKMAYRVGHTELKTASGIAFAPIYRVKELHLGQYVIKDLEVAGLDLGYAFAEGLLGMNVLGQFHFQIDQDRNHLILTPR
ncbi:MULTISPECIES: retropepsin-like aspartic protease [unclassified Endozoicomonas]|uniref:retropepsin-like aspartic protease n=1 Tax=unclassified Endozoicomonas TaxID=2644528 RepID=UPI0021490B46|nr:MULTISPECIES: retropepsin-like aspartic protease [unclassified Endozoicomonas]